MSSSASAEVRAAAPPLRPDVTVVICTYNRCDMLGDALASVLAQEYDPQRFEVIVVDNNSTDDTRRLVQRCIDDGAPNLRYIFETRQGLSHARNAGIEAAGAPIVTFTDDDVRAAPDWVANIKRAFDAHPEVDLVGGKVLPKWNRPPPAWLTQDNWSPLALLDNGEEKMVIDANFRRCLVGANLSVRRFVFDEIGTFQPDYQRVKDGIGSTEDHQFQMRFWSAGKRGLYVPDVVVTADIQNDRLDKQYHHRWHRGHGYFCAKMNLIEVPKDAITLFGMHAQFYRTLAREYVRWALAMARGNTPIAFYHESEIRYFWSYRRARYEPVQPKRPAPLEVAHFAYAMLKKKLGLSGSRASPAR